MKKQFLVITIFILGVCISFATPPINDMLNKRGFNPIKKIVIDAGHGGHDSGAVGARYKEKDLVLNMSLILGKMINLKYPDVEVIYTRTTDVFIPLHERTALANKQKADLFISIHCNAISNPSTKGTETFVMGLHRAADNLEVAKRENSVILLEENYEENYEGFDPNSPVGHIVLSTFQDAHLNRSIELASLVEKAFESRNYTKSRGVKQAGFAVLRRATMPSVLVEAGFLSNVDEEHYLGSEKGQMEIANAIFESVEKFSILNTKSIVAHQKQNIDKESIIQNINTSATQKKKSDKQPAILNTDTNNTSSKIVQSDQTSATDNRYRIQIAALQKDVTDTFSKDEKLNKIGSVYVVKDGPLYKYQVGDYASQSEARQAKDKLIALGYSNSFLTAAR